MADIKIYGTLHNDTAEPIAYAEQVKDTAQGKTQEAINAELLTKVGNLSGVYHYRGSKATIAEVQAVTDAAVGDVYNVTAAFTLDGTTYPAGTNVAKTSDGWDALGGSYSTVVGASASAAGTAGLVPAPAKGAQAQVLTGAGTFQALSHSITSSATTSSIALKVGSTSVSSLTIPVATQTVGGLQSAADKTKLALYPDTPAGIMIGAVEETVGTDTIELTYGKLDATGTSSPEVLTLPAATTEAAGLLSATDKAVIDAAATTNSGQNTDYVSNIALTQASGYPNAVHFTVQKGNSVQYKFSLATATTSVPGLMSADDKTNLDTLTSGSFTGASYDQTTRYINFTNAAGTTVASVLMVWASSSRAGLMSAGDKKKLDAYPDWETLDARIAALES